MAIDKLDLWQGTDWPTTYCQMCGFDMYEDDDPNNLHGTVHNVFFKCYENRHCYCEMCIENIRTIRRIRRIKRIFKLFGKQDKIPHDVLVEIGKYTPRNENDFESIIPRKVSAFLATRHYELMKF